MIAAVIALVVLFVLLVALIDAGERRHLEADKRQRVREATWQAGDRRWDR
jgi:hypothetical protein